MIVVFGGGEIAARGILPAVGGVAVPASECDVRDRASVRAVIRRTSPDVVIFTAGVSHPSSIAESDTLSWRDELDVNLWGAFCVASAAAAAPSVKTMIFIASLAGLYGKPNHSGYSASKAGLISLVQSLAMEGHNAYAISPGRVDTAMRQRDYPDDQPGTRLDPLLIGGLVRNILAWRYEPGDNLVIRMRGQDVLPLEVHRGDEWREKLKVGEPVTC